MAITVQDNPQRQRFEIMVDNELAGYAEYRRDAGKLVFPHTETLPAFGGRGLGTMLVTAALEAVREEGVTVLPQCWFVRDVIAASPDELLALVAAEDRAAFHLPATAGQQA